MFEFFPGNYRWSYNSLLAFAAGGQLGDFALIKENLSKNLGNDETWHQQWAWLGDVLETLYRTQAIKGPYSPDAKSTSGKHLRDM